MADGPEDFRLGSAVVRPSFNELLLEARVERLEPQVMTVLLELAKHEGRVVSRDALMANCWNGLAVTDDALTRCISRLRGVFRDVDSVAIETIPKRGYCLRVTAGDAVPAPLAASSPTARAPARQKRFAVLALAAAVLVAAIFAGLFGTNARPGPMTLGEPVPLTADPGDEQFPAVSPDASYVAYSADASDGAGNDIFVRRVDGSGAPTRLTSAPVDENVPAWSPSGGRLAYIEQPASGQCRIMILDVPRREAREVARCLADERETLDWLSEDELVVARPVAPGLAPSLFALSIADGRLRRLTQRASSEFFGDRSPRVSPEGRYLAFVRHTSWFNADVGVLDTSSGRVRMVATGFDKVTGFDWGASDRELLLAANRGDTRRVWKVGLDGALGALPLDAAQVRRIAAGRGGLIAFERRVEMYDLAEVTTTGTAAPVPIAVSTADETDAAFSPDGSRLALVSERTGRPEVWLREPGRLRQLTRSGADQLFIAGWHPGGASLLVAMRRGGGVGLHLLDIATGSMRPILDDETAGVSATWAVDGNSIYFPSLRGGRSRIWNLDIETRKLRPVSAPGFVFVMPSPDGRWLYLGDGRTPRVLRMPAAGGPATEVIAGPRVDPAAWWPTADALFFIERGSEGSARLARYDLRSGATTSRALPPEMVGSRLFALHPDGSRAIVLRRAVGDTDLLTVRPEKASAERV